MSRIQFSFLNAAGFAVLLASSAGCDSSSTATPELDAALTTEVDAGAIRRLDVTFSSDVALTGYLTAAPESPPGAPGILLVHQYQRNDEQWGDWPEVLAEAGFRVLAMNLRGHGDSDPYDGTLSALLSDPDAAPADVRAGLSYLAGEGQADPARLAVVGTSIGANLALVLSAEDRVKLAVSISARKSAVDSLLGSSLPVLKGVYLIAAEDDGGGVQASDAEAIEESATEPKKIEIHPGGAHGIAIFDGEVLAKESISEWILAEL